MRRTLGVLTQIIALRIVATKRPLLALRQTFLLSLGTLLLAVSLVVVAVVRVPVLVIRSVVRGILAGRRAEGSAGLLLVLGLRGGLLVLETAFELALGRSGRLLSE